MKVQRGRAQGRSAGLSRRRFTYLRHALLHPAQVMLLLFLPFAVAFGWAQAALAVLVAAEVGLLVVAPCTRPFRAWVDGQVYAKQCAVAARERANLLSQMTEPHRNELLKLESLADSLRDRIAPGRNNAAQEDDLGVDRLIATYARGAIAFCEGRRCLSNRDLITQQIRTLTSAAANAGPLSGGLTASRLQVAQQRAARWDRSAAELETIESQLSLIGDLIRLTYEQSVAPACAGAIRDELDAALASAPGNQQMVQELTELLADRHVPDPTVLRMGRMAPVELRLAPVVIAPLQHQPYPPPVAHPAAAPVPRTRVAEEEEMAEVARLAARVGVR